MRFLTIDTPNRLYRQWTPAWYRQKALFSVDTARVVVYVWTPRDYQPMY